jgi:tyrosyl-DNA phosphodiesterase-1
MGDMDPEDEQLRLALQMSMQEEPKAVEYGQTSPQNYPSLGAAAFLERQRSRLSPAAPSPPQVSHKVSRSSEGQTSPHEARRELEPESSLPPLSPSSHRKIRAEPIPNVSRIKPKPVIVEIDLDEEEKTVVEPKTPKLELTDNQLAIIMSKMSEEQVEAYFAGRIPDSLVRMLLEEQFQSSAPKPSAAATQPRSEPPSPPRMQVPSQMAASSSIPLPREAAAQHGSASSSNKSNSHNGATMAAPLQNSNAHHQVSPYVSPQRIFRLNWVSTIDQPEQPRRKSTDPMPEFLRLRDLICKDAQSVILTTFKVDMLWLLSTVPALLRVPSVVYHGEDRDVYAGENFQGPGTSQEKMWAWIKSQRMQQSAPATPPFRAERIHVPPSYTFSYPGCPHGKVIVVQYPGFLRIAISTANLYATDYERKTQGVWFQDFPLKGSEVTKVENALDAASAAKVRTMARDFELTIKDYFQRLVKGFDGSLFEKYDYRNVRVALITSVGANLALEMSRNYGHTKIAHVLSKEVMPPAGTKADASCAIYAQMSSVGSISGTYFESLRVSFCSSHRQAVSAPPSEPLFMVWPSSEFVRTSIDGWEAGTSLCAGAKKLIKTKVVLKSLMRYESPQPERSHITPHIKSYWRQYSDGTLGWMCLTSANFSKSAWGEIQKASRFNIANFEAGVLFLPSALAIPASFGIDPDMDQAKPVKLLSSPSLNLEHTQDGFLTISLPIPFKVNAEKYPIQQEPIQTMPMNDQPWIWDIPRSVEDSKGRLFGGISD